MKKQFNPLLGGLALSASVLALSAVWVSEASAGIANTRHNLGSNNTTQNRFASTPANLLNNEICVFCHTPHGGATGASVPLWNKGLPSGANYQVYNSGFSSSIQGAAATDGVGPGGQIGSVSLACLSCHDGTQAMNNFINAPGAGGFTQNGANMTGAWQSGNQGTATGGILGNTGTFIPSLGTNLQNDHPIGISYCGGSATTDPSNSQCPDADFRQGPNVGNNGQTGQNRAWWVENRTTTGPGRQKADLPLYTRAITGGNFQPMVECGSCHDPHSDPTSGGQPLFLRINNVGSEVCQTCHVK